MSNGASTTQRVVRYLPLAGSVIGIVLIIGSVAFFFDTNSGRILGAAGGIVVLLGAVWYASNPFLKNTRRYLHLRSEVVGFTRLVSQLNRAVVKGAPSEEIEQIKVRMRQAVDRIAAAAGKTR